MVGIERTILIAFCACRPGGEKLQGQAKYRLVCVRREGKLKGSGGNGGIVFAAPLYSTRRIRSAMKTSVSVPIINSTARAIMIGRRLAKRSWLKR